MSDRFGMPLVGTEKEVIAELRAKVEQQRANIISTRENADKRIAELEAKLDAVMLEHCPDEMTPEQVENWEKHQRRAPLREVIDELCQDQEFKAVYDGISQELRQVQASDEGTEQAEPVAWYYADGESIVTTMINPERELAVPLYTHPPKHEAVEPVAWVYKNKNTDDWYLRWTPVTESGFQQKALYTQPLVATLPHDDSALRELMMRVASETESQCMEAYSCKEDDAPFVTWPLDDDLQDIINRVLGEAK